MHYQAKKQLPLDERAIRWAATPFGRGFVNATASAIVVAFVLAVLWTPDSSAPSASVVATLGNGAM